MKFLVRRPFHSAFGFGELVDQFEEAIGLDEPGLRAERFLQLKIDIFTERIRFDLEDEKIAEIRDQVRHQTHHVFAGFGLVVQQLDRLRRGGV